MIPEQRGWREAAEHALYGPLGFFTHEAPAEHFRTSVHASPLFARAVTRLLLRVDEALGHPDRLDLVDVGAGRGELLSGVLKELAAGTADGGGVGTASGGDGAGTAEAAGPAGAGVAARLRACAVERGPRPAGLDDRIDWCPDLPGPGTVTGLLFANEWLDNVPLDIAETGPEGTPLLVQVDGEGNEHPGPPVAGEDARWLARWWPLEGTEPGSRAEIGHPRDAAWTTAVRSLRAGAAVAVDYGHTRATRPPFGTLTGYREGRQTRPVPDGRHDITAHVALDACADAAALVAEGGGVLLPQREALHRLGVRGGRPPLELAHSDPAAYVRALSAAGEAAELTAREGLGSFDWLVCPVGIASPLPTP
ncbi:SAM-dependent methyltransferase [Streptomyces iconiensis]|uniref:SAM-dependent methyltransferase n=1 Tax=Streptomyces iconiensis TaxID=1384038 RepID=A0ABT6ZSC5_9ACTN|nr:SAM-dependent methyltransferase [Streptomyces iconiensis]MDJ1131974.1 SAM-dependent methyltransferase [Streptomyces iconiensis]